MATLTIGQKVPFTAKYVDAAGNAAPVDGVATAQVDDAAKAEIVDLSADGLSGAVKALAIGHVQVQVTADADLGAGTRSLTIMGELDVIAGEAVAGTIDFGAPVPA